MGKITPLAEAEVALQEAKRDAEIAKSAVAESDIRYKIAVKRVEAAQAGDSADQLLDAVADAEKLRRHAELAFRIGTSALRQAQDKYEQLLSDSLEDEENRALDAIKSASHHFWNIEQEEKARLDAYVTAVGRWHDVITRGRKSGLPPETFQVINKNMGVPFHQPRLTPPKFH